jgi:hypothetical protein
MKKACHAVSIIHNRLNESAEQMQIDVQTYAGYKGNERPVSFSREGRIFRIMEIVDRWYDPDYNCFKVLADDGSTYLLRHDMNDDTWELEGTRLLGTEV